MNITNQQVLDLARRIAAKIRIDHPPAEPLKAYAVPRGGVPAAYAIGRFINITLVNHPQEAQIIIDDLIDSGATMDRMKTENPMALFYALIDKRFTDSIYYKQWIVFPWEGSVEGSTDDIGLRLLEFIGEDTARGGLKETPARFIKAWQHWSKGYKQEPEDIFKDFEDGGEKYDEMVLVKDIPFYSHCEHHLTPIFGVAHVAYIPDGKIVGLSKLARLVDCFAYRLQVQERLTTQIADSIQKHLSPLGVAVAIEARHLCMESRGVQKPGASTTTSKMHGVFKEKISARNEFLALIK